MKKTSEKQAITPSRRLKAAAPAAGDEALLVLFYCLSRSGNFLKTKLIRELKELWSGERDPQALSLLKQEIQTADWDGAARELEYARRKGVRLLSILDRDYPPLLQSIEDPPLLLFIRGTLNFGYPVAMVGARNNTPYGGRIARELAAKIVDDGGTVISGLARGIDEISHRGALRAVNSERITAPTVAVLGSGLEKLGAYDREVLLEEIVEKGGAVISEYGLSTVSQSWFFPRRNRIVSGLAECTVVVEAKLKSGSLITARLAAEQGREVFAVPGSLESPSSAGTNKLISDGATMLSSFEVLLERLPRWIAPSAPGKKNKQDEASLQERLRKLPMSKEDYQLAAEIITELTSTAELSFDYLLEKTQRSASSLGQLLSVLEVHGILQSTSMGCVHLGG